MQMHYDNIDNLTPSFVNIGSSILRNKFEKNRMMHSKNAFENFIELLEDDKFNILSKKSREIEVKFDNFVKESTDVDIRLTSSLNEINSKMGNFCNRSDIEQKINTVTSSLNDINSIMGDFCNRSDIEQKINTVTSRLNDINSKMGDFYNRSDIEDKIKTINSSSREINTNMGDFYSRSDIEDKINTINSNLSEINSKMGDFYTRVDIEEKMNTIDSNLSEMNSKMGDFYSRSEVEHKINTITSSLNEINANIDGRLKETKFDLFEQVDDENQKFLKLLINNLLPKDFDHENYRDSNEDLKHYNEVNLKKHYLFFGKAENRNYKILHKNAPDDFDWKEYLRVNIELLKHFSDEYNTTRHYVNYGVYEKRMYKMSQLEDVNFFIYCGRKSGSTTLNHTCSNIENSLSIQIHNNEDFLYKYGQCTFNSIFDLVENNMKKHETVYIIDSYRTPIEKKISSFFEDIEKYIPNYKDCDISFLISYFNKKYIYGNKCTHIYTEDYEPLNEILQHFNLSPIKKFNFDRKYELIRHKNLVFIKLRFHEIEKWDVLLSKILGKDVTIIDKNKSENKDYYDVYENFKKSYRIPIEYLEKLKSDSRFKIYNTSVERDKYIKYWSSKSETS